MTIDSSQIFIRGSTYESKTWLLFHMYILIVNNLTFDHSEQKTQVEDFPLIWISSIHASNGLVSLTNLPHSTTRVPDKIPWKVLIEGIMCSSSNEIRILICLEPPKQSSVLGILNHLINFEHQHITPQTVGQGDKWANDRQQAIPCA